MVNFEKPKDNIAFPLKFGIKEYKEEKGIRNENWFKAIVNIIHEVEKWICCLENINFL